MLIEYPNASLSKSCSCNTSAVEQQEVTAVRPSCLECVEKHLGASYALLTEINDGYLYRLRVIGHLHEASDESQEWPELHSALRIARKDYQLNGIIPDWNSIGNIITKIKETLQ